MSEDEIKVVDEELKEVKVPDPTDHEWTDYVISLLGENEIYDKKPTVDGLRRVAQKLLGEITYSKSKVYQYPTPENGIAATVRARIKINGRVFDGCANVNEDSAPDIIGPHVIALAETRAEGRALKKILNIRVLTKEEAGVTESEDKTTQLISSTQIEAMQKVAERHKIDLNKLIQSLYAIGEDEIDKLTFNQALQIFEKLSEFDSSKKITKEFKK